MITRIFILSIYLLLFLVVLAIPPFMYWLGWEEDILALKIVGILSAILMYGLLLAPILDWYFGL